jgi:hypothetical protein
MRVQVTFRVNAETGEVELFQVDDMGDVRQITEHDLIHEDIAYALGELIDPDANVEEVIPLASRRSPIRPVTGPAPVRQHPVELEQDGVG